MSLAYCPACDAEPAAPTAVARVVTLTVRGEPVTVSVPHFLCPACGGNLAIGGQLLDRRLRRVYAAYRARYGLLTPHAIRRLRLALGLSRRALAQELDWPWLAIQRYETGAPHTLAEDAALRALFRAALQDRVTANSPRPPHGAQKGDAAP